MEFQEITWDYKVEELVFCWYLPHWLSCILSGIFRILWLYKPYSLKPILLHRIRVFLPVNFL